MTAAVGTRTCPGCGEVFDLLTAHQRRVKRWCSRGCYHAHYRRPERRSDSPERPQKALQRPCELCGKVYTPTAAHSRYCGLSCKTTMKNRRRRKGGPNYQPRTGPRKGTGKAREGSQAWARQQLNQMNPASHQLNQMNPASHQPEIDSENSSECSDQPDHDQTDDRGPA